MIVSVAIMAHPTRKTLVDRLQAKLDRPATVAWDRRNNRWDTGKRAWQAYDPAADWHLVVQDDAIVCRDLIAGLQRALQYVPDDAVVAPFSGTRTPPTKPFEHAFVATVAQAEELGAAWVATPMLNWGVAVAAPTAVIGDMVGWCDRRPQPNYDVRVADFCWRVLRWPVWCTQPALVDHADVASLIGNEPRRAACRFIGQDVSALTVDWTAGHVWTPGGKRLVEHSQWLGVR